MKKIILALLTILTVSVSLTSCDKRKNIIYENEEKSNLDPTISVRRYISGQAYSAAFIDTFLVPATGYKLQYQVSDDNALMETIQLSAVNSGTNIQSIIHYKDSSYFLIRLNSNIGTMEFSATVQDKFGKKGTASFKLISKNQVPVLSIKRSTSPNYSYNIVDTLKKLNSTVLELDYLLNDDNATGNDIQIIKKSAGDLSVITKNVNLKKLYIDFAANSYPKTIKYDIYVTDPYTKTSDTTHLTIYYYKNLPPKAPTLITAIYSTHCNNGCSYGSFTDSLGLMAYQPQYLTFPFWGLETKVNLSVTDNDVSQGGFITKIKYKINYRANYSTTIVSRTYENSNINNAGSYNVITKHYDSVYGTAITMLRNSATLAYSSYNISGYIYDNNNDSTYFNLNPVF